MSLRVLLVDDEPAVLAAMSRMIRGNEPTWEVLTALDGESALLLLGAKAVDVLVSDMRMPKLSGDALVAEVRERYPSAVRILLTGQADRNASLRSIGAAHRFLCKPCEPVKLVNAIRESYELRQLLDHPGLAKVASGARSLPSAPSLYIRLTEELEDPNCSAERIGEIVSQDVAMAAKVLQLVNSSFFGLARPVVSPAQACMVLGTDTLSSIVAMADSFSRFGSAIVGGISVEEVQMHSLSVGLLSRRVASLRPETEESVETAFLAGLLHDSGKLLLASAHQEYGKIVRASIASNVPVDTLEREMWNSGHGEVGAYLLGLWGLNDVVVEAVAFHHHPDAAPTQGFNVACCVHIADALARASSSGGLSSATEELLSRFDLLEEVRPLAA
jgi:putative nucleotidyltransferase with HDIG domain